MLRAGDQLRERLLMLKRCVPSSLTLHAKVRSESKAAHQKLDWRNDLIASQTFYTSVQTLRVSTC